MRPLEPLSELEHLLRGAPALRVGAELARLDALVLDRKSTASRSFGHGALALREGRFLEAVHALDAASAGFDAADEGEAAELARAEFWLARVRIGGLPASHYGAGTGYGLALQAFQGLASSATTRRVRVVATHYLGTAFRSAGRTEETQKTLLAALAESEGLLPERAQLLNSLGTLYVLLGAYGAARSLLEHAADLAKRLKDTMGEAIAYGQLGSAALAQGEPDVARRCLQRQEWLARSIGDAFGGARALVFLAELSLDRHRPDEAIDLAERALELALSVEPRLTIWFAYATRLRGRARLELADPRWMEDLTEAARAFSAIGNQLGDALVTWDRARAGELAETGEAGWGEAAWVLGSLGLAPRVAQLLVERRRAHSDDLDFEALDSAIAACAQGVAPLAAAHEVELLYERPETLAQLSGRRVAGQRNTGRLAALVLAPPGLFVAVLVHPEIGGAISTMPPTTGTAVCLGGAPSLAVWGWRGDTLPSVVSGELAAARGACADLRAALGWSEKARVVGLPMAGESGANVTGMLVDELARSAVGAAPGALVLPEHVPWHAAALRAWG